MIKDCTPEMTPSFDTISFRLGNNNHCCPVALLLHNPTTTDMQGNVASRHPNSSGCQLAVHPKTGRDNAEPV